MSRSSFSWPLAIIAGFAVFMAMLLVGSLNELPAAAQTGTCAEGSAAYPQCVTQTVSARRTNTAQVVAQQTGVRATELAVTRAAATAQGNCVRESGEIYPCPDSSPATNTPTTDSGGGGGNPQPAATSTFTPTATSTDDGEETTPTDDLGVEATATFSPTATDEAGAPTEETDPASPSPTTLLPAGVELLTCVPGTQVELSGTAPPNTPLLILFGERTVGGGLSNSAGAYRLRLQIGEERPGIYLVDVREREGRDLVDQFGCEVPPFTPTPTVVR